jgi:hypothetical protein
MVLDNQAECQGKAGVITDKYSVYSWQCQVL